MSAPKLRKAATGTRDAMLTVLWRQWASVGGGASAQPAHAVIDPEALILASLALQHDEPRLWVVMREWLREGVHLLSVQRLRNVRALFPEAATARVGTVAWIAVHEAKDARWRRWATGVEDPGPAESKRRSAGPSIRSPAALVLRLRSGFGIGAKADALAFLLGRGGSSAPIARVVQATAYTQPAVFRGLKELVAAELVHVSRSTPAEYGLDLARWRAFLALPDPAPSWRYWSQILAYGLRFLEWADRRAERDATDYAMGSLWRTLAEENEAALALAGIVSSQQPLPASADVAAWAALHDRLAQWVVSNA